MEQQASEKLSVREKLGYGFTSFGSGCWSSFISTFLLYFYTNVAGIRPAVASTIISLSVIWDAINDPLFASVADNHTFRNGEKMRPLLVYASVPLAVLLVLMFVVVGNGWGTVIYAFLTYFLFRIPSTLHALPMNAMRQLASPLDSERVSLGAWATGGGSFGMAISAVAFWPLIRAIAGLDAEGQMIAPRRGFFIAAAIVGAILVAASFYNYCTTKERVHPAHAQRVPFFTACRVILRNRNFNLNLALTFFYGMLSTLVSTYALYYCSYVLGRPGLATPVSAMYILGIVVSLPFVSLLFKKLGRKGLFTLSAIILTAGSAVLLVFARQIFAPFLFCFCIGVGTEFASVLLSLNRADITDIIEHSDTYRLDGMVSNVTNFIQKCATAVLTFILGLVLEFTHFDGNLSEQPASAVTAIILIMGLGSLLASAGMFIGSYFLRIDDDLSAISKDSGSAAE